MSRQVLSGLPPPVAQHEVSASERSKAVTINDVLATAGSLNLICRIGKKTPPNKNITGGTRMLFSFSGEYSAEHLTAMRANPDTNRRQATAQALEAGGC